MPRTARQIQDREWVGVLKRATRYSRDRTECSPYWPRFLQLSRCFAHKRQLTQALYVAERRIGEVSLVLPTEMSEVPRVVRRLRQFLRGSFDQHERILVTREEELAVVRDYSGGVLRTGAK
jgi:hypothetical protein